MRRRLGTCGMILCLLLVIMMPIQVAAQSTLVWPVPGHTSLSQGFHSGNAIDISDGSIYGAEVVAAMGGTVTNIWLSDCHHTNQTDADACCRGFGTGIVITGDDGRIYQYAHMLPGSVPSNVYYGAYVSAGQKIGQVGSSGFSTGAHLHFGISWGNYWNASGINPQNENYTYNTPSVQVSLSWNNSDCQYDTTNAYMYIETDTNVSGSFTEAGITVWNEVGGVVGTKTEDPGITGKHLNIWYNLTDELGIVLKQGTNYTYQFHVVFNGQRYTSSVMSFRTRGQSTNAWITELSIKGWTYGDTANKPSAVAKYGKVVFTYSTEKYGVYTATVPKNVGTYYVKATVAATDEYTGLEAIKEFKIEKATSHIIMGWQKNGSSWYFFDTNGVALTGWQKISGKWYYFGSNGAMHVGWLKSGFSWYYLDGNGAMQTGWAKIGSKWYFMDSSGAMQTGWLKDSMGWWYYLESDGSMQKGWHKVGFKWYYFNSSGVMQTGWQKIGSSWYYLNPDGSMVNYNKVIDGRMCRFNSSGAWLGYA